MEPTMETMPPQMPQEKSNGALMGSVIIIIILVLGGIYILMQNKKQEVPMSDSLAGQSSEDLGSIEADLNTMDLDSLDSEI